MNNGALLMDWGVSVTFATKVFLRHVPARKFCSVKNLAGFLLRVSFSSEISVTKVLVFLVSFDSHSILDILCGTHGHSDGHPGPSKKTIPSIQVGIRRFMLRSSKVASI